RPPPSTQITDRAAKARATSPSRLVLALRGDLDAIAAKALSDDPALRYANAAPFAEDLQRYLTGHPVEARGRRLTYRIAKFLRRHRTALAIAAVCSVTFMALTLYAMLHQQAGGGATLTPLTLPSERSVAVLPFADMSEKHDQEYFSDGLTDELINRLAHGPD